MEKDKFQTLIKNFERNIVIEGIRRKRFPHIVKNKSVPTKNCKLSNKEFGKIIGRKIDTNMILVIDYYGYFKKSRGFIEEVWKYRPNYPQELRTMIVHFPSIRMEDIAVMTDDVAVMLDFPRLKNEILILRGFRKRLSPDLRDGQYPL